MQYSEKPFPVFVLTSSLISVKQKNWSGERQIKAGVREQSILDRKEKKNKENIWILSLSVSGAGCKYPCAIHVDGL